MKSDSINVGAIMRACRERAGLSQEQLSEILYRSRSCISKYETDKKIPCFHTMMHWAEATGSKDVLVAIVSGVDVVSILQNLLTVVGFLLTNWRRSYGR